LLSPTFQSFARLCTENTDKRRTISSCDGPNLGPKVICFLFSLVSSSELKEQNGFSMIRATSTRLEVSVSGLVVYLDTWAIGELAEHNPSRRRRFVQAVRAGVDLLFSVTNAAELSGPKGRSAEAVREFLDEIGPRWFPAEHNPTEIVRREEAGANSNAVCASKEFMGSYFSHVMRNYPPRSGKVVEMSDKFLRLGAMLDWVAPQRESNRAGSAKWDQVLKEKLGKCAEQRKRDVKWLDKMFPRIPFDPARRGSFVFHNLLRTLVVEANQLKPGDGLDFCHAVVASAYASFAALDKNWKRRVLSLPKPNSLARIYYKPELDSMVTDMEYALTNGWCGPAG
jgi:hypothetical protein